MADTKEEIRKIFGSFADKCGILNICYDIYFPYLNQDAVDFGFMVQRPEDKTFDLTLMDEKKIGHFVRNRSCLALARKNGRLVCHAGFPVQMPLKGEGAMGSFEKGFDVTFYIHMDGKYIAIRIPVAVKGADEDHPYVMVKYRFDMSDQTPDRRMGAYITCWEPTGIGWEQHGYRIGDPFGMAESADDTLKNISPQESGREDLKIPGVGEIMRLDSNGGIAAYGDSWGRAVNGFLI